MEKPKLSDIDENLRAKRRMYEEAMRKRIEEGNEPIYELVEMLQGSGFVLLGGKDDMLQKLHQKDTMIRAQRDHIKTLEEYIEKVLSDANKR